MAELLARLKLVDAFEHQKDKTLGRDAGAGNRYSQFNHGNREKG